MKNKRKERIIGLDIVRVLAIFFVIGLHFFRYTEFYVTPVTGWAMICQVILRNLFICAVPLFLLLMGYFSKDDKYTLGFFKKLLGIFVLYVLYVFVEYAFTKEGMFSVGQLMNLVFGFNISAYMWFVEMYIGLYLLSPFLNILYNNLNEKMKKYLLILLIGITALPYIMNKGVIDGFQLPEYWVSIFPVTYFYLGKYIKEFQPKFKKFQLLVTLTILLLICSLIEVKVANGWHYQVFTAAQEALPVMVISVIIFLIFYDIVKTKPFLDKIFSSISLVSFDMYLVSRTVQFYVYPYFLQIDIPAHHCILYLFPAVLMVFILTYIIGTLRRFLIKIR